MHDMTQNHKSNMYVIGINKFIYKFRLAVWIQRVAKTGLARPAPIRLCASMPEQSRKELSEYKNFLFLMSYLVHLNTLYSFTRAQFWLF